MKKFLGIIGGSAVVLVTLALVLAGPVHAADFLAPSGNDGNVTVNQTETHNNLYIAGGNISVDGPVTGDLYAAGGSISVDGRVDQDIVVLGGTVLISEPVNGDVRVVGGQVTINAPVKGDVLAAGGTLIISDKASIGGELRAASGSVTVNGPVSGGVYLTGGSITLNSKIDGNVKVQATKDFTVGPSAVIASEISYVGNQNANVDSNAKANVSYTSLAQHDRDHGKRNGIIGFLIGGAIIKFFAFLIAGLLFLHYFRPKALDVADAMYNKPWSSLGIGFALAIAVPIAAIICLILLVGYFVAIMALAAYLLVVTVAVLLTMLFMGAWVIKLVSKKPTLALDWQALVLGIIIFFILSFVPVVGWVIQIGFFLTAFGAVAATHWQKIRHVYRHIEE